jgi:hypothetical protein
MGMGRNGRLAGRVSDRNGSRILFQYIRGMDMTQAPKLSYRVVKASPDWCWEVLNDNHDVLASGKTATSVKARAEAMLAVISIHDGHVKSDPASLIHHNKMTRRT